MYKRQSSYNTRVYQGFGKGDYDALLKLGPNIKDWPEIAPLGDNLLLKVASYITDPVTTTDELIPSGETSSFRSNPLRLAEFTLSRKDPAYVGRAKAVKALDEARTAGTLPEEVQAVYAALEKAGYKPNAAATNIGSAIFANKPGDGSAREQAASCQKVLGGWANIANEYATKRYRSNLINWGMIPFVIDQGDLPFHNLDYLFVPKIREAIADGKTEFEAYVVKDGALKPFTLRMGELTPDEKDIILKGCLINYYRG